MRQLKGKVKENAKEKKERKKEFAENRDKAFSVGNLSIHRLHFFQTLIYSSIAYSWRVVCTDCGPGLRGYKTQAIGVNKLNM